MRKSTGVPLHIQISGQLDERIQAGAYRKEVLFPTEFALMEEFQVSRGTLRKALKILEDRGFLVRKPGIGTFVTDPNEDLPHEDRMNLVGIAIPNRVDQLSHNIMAGAETVLRRDGFGLIYGNLEDHLEKEKALIRRMRAQKVSGIILFPIGGDEEARTIAEVARSLPFVVVDRDLPNFKGSSVMADHYQGSYMGVEYLINLGHRRIGIVSHLSEASSIKERIQGYVDAMREHGLIPLYPVNTHVTITHPPNLLPDCSENEMYEIRQMLTAEERPSAIFCVNDNIASGVMRLALRLGLRVPEDMSILGFDNSQFSQLTPVPLSSVAQDGVAIGERAAELLLRHIRNPLEKPQKVLLNTHLVERQSTAAWQPLATLTTAALLPNQPE